MKEEDDKIVGYLFHDVFNSNTFNTNTNEYIWLKNTWLNIYKDTLSAPISQIEFVQVKTSENYVDEEVERLTSVWEAPNGIKTHELFEDERTEIKKQVIEHCEKLLEKTPEYARILHYVFVPVKQIIYPYNITFREFLEKHTQTYKDNTMMELPILYQDL